MGLGECRQNRPKCLLQFGNETLLAREVRLLVSCGIRFEDILIVTGYKSECIESLYPSNVLYNPHYNASDNAYSLYLALKMIDEDVLVLDGDLAFEKKTLQTLIDASADTLLSHVGDVSYGSTGIQLRNDGSVLEIGKHVTNGLIYDSMLHISRATVREWGALLSNPLDQKSWYTVSLNKLVKYRKIQSLTAAGMVADIDTHFDYIEAKRLFGIENFTILVTGASGLLGEKIYHILRRYYQVQGVQFKSEKLGFISLDLTDKHKLDAFLELNRPQVIINAAGIAEPEKCESNPALAESINVQAVRHLVESCRKYRIKLIHISTDYVFEGESYEPYEHEAERCPKNFYGELKKQAEDVVRNYQNSLIVRLPVLYGYNSDEDKETFPIRVMRSLSQGNALYLDNKQVRYPVLIDEVALGIKESLRQTGIMHITSGLPCTKYSWAKIIAKTFGLSPELIGEDEGSNLKDRPPHTRLAVGPGDCLVSDINFGTSILAKQMHCVFRLIYKSSPASEELGFNVGAYRYRLGKLLAKSVPESVRRELDCVVPVPSSGLYYAMGLADALSKPYVQGVFKPDTSTRSFQLANIALRAQIIRDKIVAICELIEGKNIALVDEAIFTGITLKVVCDMLKGCGVGKIYICIPTPVCGHRCQQYVQPEHNLLAEILEIEEMNDFFGVEGLYFQEYVTFQDNMTGIPGICYECFRESNIGI